MIKIFKYVTSIIFIIIVLILIINFYIKFSTKSKIISDYSNLPNSDCILVLGAAVWGKGPSPLLEDRLLKGIEVYNNKSLKIIMSGDHGQDDYDEVNVMKKYAINKNIPSENIFMDHAGFSTYDSLYRLKNIFKVKKVIIVTQEYHLYRALYIAKKLGIDAYGVPTEPKSYRGDTYREIREILARNKDFFKCLIKPSAKVMGDEISLSESGDITNDKNSFKKK